MKQRDNDESAFPEIVTEHNYARDEYEVRSVGGMTLRDYFAAKWLTTIVIPEGAGLPPDVVARDCYRMADAMLKTRNA